MVAGRGMLFEGDDGLPHAAIVRARTTTPLDPNVDLMASGARGHSQKTFLHDSAATLEGLTGPTSSSARSASHRKGNTSTGRTSVCSVNNPSAGGRSGEPGPRTSSCPSVRWVGTCAPQGNRGTRRTCLGARSRRTHDSYSRSPLRDHPASSRHRAFTVRPRPSALPWRKRCDAMRLVARAARAARFEVLLKRIGRLAEWGRCEVTRGRTVRRSRARTR